MRGRSIAYSADELAWLDLHSALPIGDYHRCFNLKFGRDVSAPNLAALRKRQGWTTGRTGCFPKGHTPHNKGKPHPSRGRAVETQFKKGGLPHNTKWLGHERVTQDGYIEVSVAEPNPYTGFGRRYVLKHIHEWEAVNGPVPEGHCLKGRDGDRTNTDPANWLLIPRAILPRLNGGRFKTHLAYDEAAPEVRPALIAIAKVDHKARELRRRKNRAAA